MCSGTNKLVCPIHDFSVYLEDPGLVKYRIFLCLKDLINVKYQLLYIVLINKIFVKYSQNGYNIRNAYRCINIAKELNMKDYFVY